MIPFGSKGNSQETSSSLGELLTVLALGDCGSYGTEK